MARNVAILATMPSTTELGRKIPLLTSAEYGGVAGQRWWILDLDVRADYQDTTRGGYQTPDRSGVASFPPRCPLHVSIEYDARGPVQGWAGVRVIDAVPGRYLIFAANVTVNVLAPASSTLINLDVPGDPKIRGVDTLVAVVSGGLGPAGCDGRAPAGGGSMDASFTARVGLGGGAAVAVRVPAGARSLQIFDSAESPWDWTEPTIGRIGTTGGHSDVVAVPTCLSVAPTDLVTAREAACVFGVHL